MGLTLPGIYAYHDYRLFLRDAFDSMRAAYPDFNLRSFAAKAGLSSHSFCSAVVNGKRNLTRAAVKKFVKGLGLESNQAEYFHALVAFNQEDEPAKKDVLFAKVNNLRRNSSYYRLNKDHLAYFSHWSLFVIRELAALSHWNGDYARLGKMVHPPLSAAAAKKAVKTLVRIGMLKQQADGAFTQSDTVVSTRSIPDHLIRKIRAQFIELSKQASEERHGTKRDLSSATVALASDDFDQAVQILQNARARILELAKNKKTIDRVFQVNLHIFQVSEPLAQDDPSKNEIKGSDT